MDGRPNRRNKAACSNFSGVEWTLPQAQLCPMGLYERDAEISYNSHHVTSSNVSIVIGL